MSQLVPQPCHTGPPEIRSGRKLLLIGNPNVGKSLLFGCLTNRYVTVSNYPGTTVEITMAKATLAGEPRLVIDTPGTNGLVPQSDDERVARDMLITTSDADVLQVGAMSNLRRTILLSLQLAEHEIPFTLCLNMSDEARAHDNEIDPATIAKAVGVPVVATSALRRWNLERLKREALHPSLAHLEVIYSDAIEQGVTEVMEILSRRSAVQESPSRRVGEPARADSVAAFSSATSRLGDSCGGWTGEAEALTCSPPTPPPTADRRPPIASRGIALSVLSGDESLKPFLPHDALADLDRVRAGVQCTIPQPVSVVIANARLAAIDRILGAEATRQSESKSNVLDWIGIKAMHPIWGVPFLAAVLYIAWLFVGNFGAGTLVDFVETKIFEERVNVWAIAAVEWMGMPKLIRDLLVGPYGIITMAITYAIAIVLPVVITFFLFFGVLEDSGYLPRLAVMLNRIFRRMGLNGKAVLPMVLGLGCDTMATLTTRILETKKEATIVTILLALGVPCSAQLGVIMAMLGPLAPTATLLWLGMIVGTIFLVGYLASKVVPGEAGDFLLEIPPIRVPKLSNIAIKVLARTEWYLKEAVPLFILGTLLLYLLDALRLLGAIQRALAPVVVGLLGLPAEAANAFVIGFLRRDYGAAGLFAMQQDGKLDGIQTIVALTTITLFIPCIANFLVILKERGRTAGFAIAGFVLLFSFGAGAALNFALRAIGVSL